MKLWLPRSLINLQICFASNLPSYKQLCLKEYEAIVKGFGNIGTPILQSLISILLVLLGFGHIGTEIGRRAMYCIIYTHTTGKRPLTRNFVCTGCLCRLLCGRFPGGLVVHCWLAGWIRGGWCYMRRDGVRSVHSV